MADNSSPTVKLSAARRALLRRMLEGEGAPVVEDGIPRRPEPGWGVPSYEQERLWFLDQLEPGSPAYSLPAALRLRGTLDREALRRSLEAIVHRHESLRTTFSVEGGELRQRIHPPAPFELPVHEVEAGPGEPERQACMERWAAEEAGTPFDLVEGPLFRVKLLRLDAGDHLLLVTMHHIVSDGWSVGIMLREMRELYAAFCEGRPAPAGALPVQYADYAHWQRSRMSGDVLQEQLDYWTGQLRGAPAALELPTDRPRPAVRDFRGATLPFALDDEVGAALRELARREGATLFMVLLAGYQALLARYSGQDDVVVGTPVTNRARPEVEEVIGFFANTLVLRAELGDDPSFRTLLARVRERALGAFAHQAFPLGKLVEALAPERDLGRNPLFQAMFALQNTPAERFRLAGLEMEMVRTRGQASRFDLTLLVRERGERLEGMAEYSTELFEPATVERFLAHFGELLRHAAASPDTPLSRLPLLAPAEREEVLAGFGRGADAPAEAGVVHELFEEQAARTPAAVAVRWKGESVTYAELDRRANQLAHALRGRGAGPEERVGVCLSRSPQMLVALLGVLKSGAAYVPIDAGLPAERIGHMLADASVRLVVSESALAERIPAGAAELLVLDGEREALAREPETAPRSGVLPGHLSHVIFTSGSTGRPKGVAIQHRGTALFLRWLREVVPAQEWACVLGATSISFDVSVAELFGTLCSGGRLVLVENALELAEVPASEGVRLVVMVPTAAAELLRMGAIPESVRAFNLAGEALSAELAGALHALEHVRSVRNLYGPTEDTTYSTFCEVERGAQRVHIGRPIAGSRAYVLDAHLEPLPVGVPGELYLAGEGLARGYAGRPELTAERFVPEPHGPAGARMYRTMDRARWLASGELEYLGRTDAQVKVRGFRVELGEIEIALERHASVHEAVVLLREDAPGERRLVAYVVPDGAAPTPAELREHLREQLPEYMVPGAFVLLEALPLTTSGKIDRKALPAPEGAESAEAGYVAPRTPTEEVLAGIWGDVLGVERVGVEESFFELGGHSLLATRVASRVREAFGVELPLRALFEAPTVARLVERVDALLRAGAGVGAPPLVAVGRGGALPLSFAQQRLWFIDQLEPGSATYNIPQALRLRGALEVELLERALTEVVRRHESLRTTFSTIDGQLGQVVHPPAPVAIRVTDLRHLPGAEREERVRQLAAEDALRPFDLAAGPLFRTALLRLDEEEWALLLSMHHIVSDGWSMGVLVREISALYSAFSRGEPSSLAPLPVQYADYAVWQRQWLSGETLEAQLGYWRERLAGAPALLELPTDRPRPAVQSFRGAVREVSLPAELFAEVRRLARAEAASPYMVLLAAFQLLLSRHSGQDDVVVGSPIAGRTRAEVEPLIGLFMNTLVLRTAVSAGASFRELLSTVREATLGAYAHQELPFERLVEELQPERDLSRNPLFQVVFALQNLPGEHLRLPGLEGHPLPGVGGGAKFDLSLYLRETEGRLEGTAEYGTDLFDAATIERLLGHYGELLRGVLADPGAPAGEVALLPAGERAQVLEGFNDTARSYPRESCVHQLFEAQAARTPDAVALVCGDERLRYAELERRANRLAHRLRALGVGPEVRVGICVERSVEMVVGLLGILKAGGAYLPLDPEYPAPRLAFMARDAGIRVLVTQDRLRGLLPGEHAEVCLDARPDAALHPDTAPSSGVAPENVAYVIYTSGSTGTPKGVMVPHRTVANFFAAMDGSIGEARGTWLAVTSISFDISVLELFWTLARGFTVVVQRPQPAVPAGEAAAREAAPARPVAFGLFYFGTAEDEPETRRDQYRLVMESARFADEHGFSAVWTPERHFHQFGGLYPNPSVMAGALAAITSRVGIRAGSVVLPLHSSIRVAEEWALVDNLSGGRVGVSFASGWHADDFVLHPDRYADRKEVMFREMETVRALWRGESVRAPGGTGREVEVVTRPRPLQPELPVWVTAAASPETFERAGAIGAHVLTHLLGQELEDVERNVEVYRRARRENGHDPEAGIVTVMLHTFVGEDMDEVRERVRRPFCAYLKSSLGLLQQLVRSVYPEVDVATLPEEDLDTLLEAGFERFLHGKSLIGTPDACLATVERLSRIGVDEVACLVDFGVDTDTVLDSLRHLDTVRERAQAAPRPRPAAAEEEPFAAQVRRHGVTHLQCTPSLAQMLASDAESREALGSLRHLLVGGEALPVSLARQLTELGSLELHNMYGPTETTVWSATHRVREVGASVPIGTPVANTRVYVVDPGLAPAPIGVPGELLIGGDGVTRGYLGRPELTADRFLPDPFAGEAGARMYRTGDRARWRADGTLEFLGRTDQQVKVRGHRVEPGEIEAVLREHPGVAEAVVSTRPDATGSAILVAYVVAEGAAPAVDALRERVRERLPRHMEPSAFVFLAALPLTPNGKVDRRALPDPEPGAATEDADYVAPRSVLEERLAGLWAELLGARRVGIHDDFFHLGGHSILATQLVGRVSAELGVRVPLRVLYTAPTLAKLAAEVEVLRGGRGAPAPPPLVPVERTGPLPLSLSQQRLWFLYQMAPLSPAYNDLEGLRIRGELDVAALQRAFAEIVRRHEMLRTAFGMRDGMAAQLVAPSLPASLPFADLSAVPENRRNAELERLARTVVQRPFALEQLPLFRVVLARLAEREHVLVLSVHHIVWDGWSLGVFADEMNRLYAAYSRGEPSPLAPLAVQYADFAHWQREWLQGEALEAHQGYWREKLAGAPTLALPTDHPRPAEPSGRGGREDLRIPAALAEGVRALSRSEEATLYTTLLALFQVVLAHHSGQDDVVVGTDVAGRHPVETEPMIGFFINQLVLRTRLAGNPTFRDLLGRVRETVLEAFDHQDLPFDRVVSAVVPDREGRGAPLFQAKFVLQNVRLPDLGVSGLSLEGVPFRRGTAKFDLLLNVMERGDLITGSLEYDADLFERATVRRLLEHYLRLLEAVVERPEVRLAELFAALAEAERLQEQRARDERSTANLGRLKGIVRRTVTSNTEGD
ncbi:MAG TPA: amino acid adenylation domain-containing protein [Longimicrobiaceae bacterium]|nr:amino acid adenylation domain-containing protein [Longimicrobiaceae bacterium]